MKTAKYFLLFASAILFSYAPVFAGLELRDAGENPLLIAKPDPVLAGIEPLCVVVLHSSSESNKSDLLWRNIKRKAEGELKKAGIEVIAIPDNNYPAEIPELRIAVDLLRQGDSSRFSMHVQISLARLVYIDKGGSLSVKTDVWTVGPAMELSSLDNMQAVINREVTKQVNVFINACLAANRTKVSSDPNAGSFPPAGKTAQKTSADKSAPAKYPYVTSKNGKVFHKADCIWVSRIKPENLVGYNSRDEAIAVGKKPCKQCKP